MTDSLATPGTTLGSYRIERLLGRGGMGTVFLAYDTTLHRQVALKVIDGPADGEASRAKLLREARNAAALNHPNICTIHEVGDEDGSAFIAMEYVEGRSLSQRLEDSAIPLDEVLRYGMQAAEALAYAHDHGVVHRDFKAANAIITTTGRLKIVDFGLARRGDALMAGATTVSSIVPAGTVAGTPYAMAPEQVRGEVADARTDVWALGVLLYEMVSGTKPFDAPTMPDELSSILRDAPVPLRAPVPAALRSVIERCLEKEPVRRYQQAGDVRAALEAIAVGTVSPWAAWRYHLNRRRRLVSAVSVLAIGVLLVALDAGGARARLGIGAPAPIKLAVLPFENLTGDPEQEYLSAGLTDEMITRLGRLHPARLSVIARTSSMQYKNRETPIDQIGRELGVDYVLEGSARREGNRVSISARLIQVRDQTQRWADSFDRELAGILALQNDVARGVAGALALALLPAEQTRLGSARPVNPEAYEAYLRGVSYAERHTRTDLDTALRHFEMALEKDPTYALGHAGISAVWGARLQMRAAPRSEAERPMKAALAKALELDDTLPEVHLRLAQVATWTDYDWAAGERSFRRAIDLNPNFAEARAFYAQYLNVMKRPNEAMTEIERAIELDPLSPMIQALYGNALNTAGRTEEAIAQFRNALRTAPNNATALGGINGALHRLGRYEEAVAAQRARATARGDRAMDEALAQGYAAGGYQGAMRRGIDVLEARARSQNVAAIPLALMYVHIGEQQRALDWLERAYDERDPNLPSLSNRHGFDPLRDHPRYQALLRKMKLPM